nr:glycosyltransferase family 2 protein [uncultured Halomonas sp.]
MPMISVIMPAFNSERFIVSSIESVQRQSFPDWELVIVDDCSTDQSFSIIEEMSQADSRIKLLRLDANGGAAVARNAGIQHAQGRYIAFLDSDDTWLPYKLERQLEFIRHKKAAFVFSAYRKVDDKGNDLGIVGVPEKVTYHKLLKSCVIGCLTVMYDTHALGKVEMPLIRKRQDFGLWLRLLKRADYAYGQNEVLAEYTVRVDSISFNKKSAASYQWKLYREVERLSLLQSCYYFAHYAALGMLKAKCPAFARGMGILD